MKRIILLLFVLVSFFTVQANVGVSDIPLNERGKKVSENGKIIFPDIRNISESLSLPIIEGFNSETIPSGWTQRHIDGNSDLRFVTTGSNPSSSPKEGTHMIYWNSYNIDSGNTTRLSSPPISIAGESQLYIEFHWFHGNDYQNKLRDGVQVQYSTDNGATWINHGSFIQRYRSSIGWDLKSITIDNLQAENILIGFLFESEYGANCFMDNIKITVPPTCFSPTDLTVSEISNLSARLSWTIPSQNTGSSYDVYVSTNSTPPVNGTIPTLTVESGVNSALIPDLNPLTTYYLSVRSNCGSEDGKSAWSDYVTFKTFQTPAQLPFICNFDAEDPQNDLWQLENGNQANKWFIGTTTASGTYNNIDGGLYVSNSSQGTTNNYEATSSYVLAFRTINLENAGLHNVKFDWRSNGYSNNDFLRVFLVPESVNLTAGVNNGITSSNTPSGWISLDGGSSLINATTWQTIDKEIELPAGNYNLVFFWQNIYYYIYNPPAAIDNIKISYISCKKPLEFALTNLSYEQATFSWTPRGEETEWNIYISKTPVTDFTDIEPTTTVSGDPSYTDTGMEPGTRYYIYVQALCGIENKSDWSNAFEFTTLCTPVALPLTEGFNTPDQNSNPDCWYQQHLEGTKNLTYVTSGSSPTVSSPLEGTRMLSWPSTTSNGNKTRLVSIPVATNGLSDIDVDFWWFHNSLGTATSYLTEGVQVQYSVDGVNWTDAGSFIRRWGANNEWIKKSVPLTGISEYEYIQIGLLFTSNAGYNCFLDNLEIKAATECRPPSALRLLSKTTTSASIGWDISVPEPANGYEIYYSSASETPSSETSPVNSTQENNINILGLSPNTMYYVWVRSACGEGNTSEWSEPFSFFTNQVPADLPFICNFESVSQNNELTLLNGSENNKWFIGSIEGVSNGQGSKGLYVSDNNGRNNSYDVNRTSYVYAYRTVNISNTGTYNIKFDWKSDGETSTDIARVFLVPESELLIAGESYGMSSATNTVPPGWIELSSPLYNSTEWQSVDSEFIIDGTSKPTGIYNLVFFWKNNNSTGTNPPAAIDNVSLKHITCLKPVDITVNNITTSSATISWVSRNQETQWNIIVSDTEITDFSSETPSLVNGTSEFIAENLEEYTEYYIYLRSVCGENDHSEWTTSSFTTLMAHVVAELPYSCDFSDISENAQWALNNGTQTNKWVINSTTTGTYAVNDGLYISNDNGLSNSYSHSISYVYASRSINITQTGNLFVKFDWRAYGESSYDLLRAFLIPETLNADINGGTSNGMTGSENTVPNGWISLTSGKLNLKSTWQHVDSQVQITETGVYNLVFFWKNDGSTGSDPAAAVDNIDMRFITCPLPTNVSVNSITQNSAAITWTAGSNETSWNIIISEQAITDFTGVEFETVSGTPTYAATALNHSTTHYVYVQASCAENDLSEWTQAKTFTTLCGSYSLPFVETFPTTTFPTCWTRTSLLYTPNNVMQTSSMTESTYWSIASTSSTTAARINIYGTGRKNWLITPTLEIPASGNYSVKFDVKLTDYSNETSAPGRGSDDKFIVIISMDGGQSWDPANATVWSSEQSADYQYNSLNQNYQTIEIPFTANTGNIKVAFYGESTVSNEDDYLYVDNIYVIQTPDCRTPSAVTVNNITENSADITWTAVNSESSWNIIVSDNEIIDFTGIEFQTVTDVAEYEATGLDALKPYYVYVQAVCGPEETSEWSNGKLFTTIASSRNDILDLTFVEQISAAVINNEEHTVNIEVGNTVDLNGLIPSITVSPNATISPESGLARDFSTPVVYTVTAQNGTDSQEWTVTVTNSATVSNENDIILFELPEQLNPAVIDTDLHTITLEVRYDSDLTGLIPSIITSPMSTISPESNTAQDFSSPVTYTVTSESGGSQNWIVTVTLGQTPVGANCSNPVIINGSSDIPYTVTGQSTCGLGYELNSNCYSANGNGEDAFYRLDITEAVYMNFKMDVRNAQYSNISLFDDCPSSDNPALICAGTDSNGTDSFEFDRVLYPGTYYLVADINDNGNCINDYDLSITPVTVNCLPVSDITITGITQQTADVSWTRGFTETSWNIKYGLSGFNIQNEGTLLEGITNPYTITGLDYNTSYDVYVQSVCNENTNSSWTGPVNFATLVSCPVPENILIENIQQTSATINWTAFTVSDWSLIISENFLPDPDADNNIINVTVSSTYQANSLQPNTKYYVYIKSNCNSESTRWSSVEFRTQQVPATLPFDHDFENGPDNYLWTLENENQANKWHIGNAAAARNSSNGLYISGNNGSINNYVHTTSYVYAYRTIEITEEGTVYVSFDWRSNGENNNDLLRAFLVPESVELNAGNAYGMTESNNNTPENWISLSGDNPMQLNPEWQNHSSEVYVPQEGLYNITFFWKNNASSGIQPPAAVDNIIIHEVNCPIPTDIAVSNITGHSARISWTGATEDNWNLIISETPVDDLENAVSIPLTENFYDTTGLSQRKLYYYYLQAACSGENRSEWASGTFNTIIDPVTVPYDYSFDEDLENSLWTLENETQINKWYIGNTTSGEHTVNGGLYISTDQGATNSYSITDISSVFAYRPLSIDQPGIYSVNYDWRAYGEANVTSSYDYLRVFLVPSSVELTAGNQGGISFNNTPAGWISLDNGASLVQQNERQYIENREVMISQAGTYNIVFYWRNDGSVGEQPPASIENFKIESPACPKPVSININNITHESAEINWIATGNAISWNIIVSPVSLSDFTSVNYETVNNNTSYLAENLVDNSSYYVYIRSACDPDSDNYSFWTDEIIFTTKITPALVPYSHDFISGSPENNNWVLNNGSQSNKWFIGSTTSVEYPVTDGLYISNDNGASNSYSDNQSYIYAYRTIKLDETGFYTFEFDWRANGEGNYDLLRAFVVPESLNADLSAGNANGMTYSTNTTPNGWISLTEGKINLQTSWQHVNSEIAIEQAGNYNLVFFWKNNTSSSYPPAAAVDNIVINHVTCRPPQEITVTGITHSDATITWNPGLEETNWNIIVSPTRVTDFENVNSTPVSGTGEYNATDLLPTTTYYVYIQSDCGDGDNSRWSSEFSFTTDVTCPAPGDISAENITQTTADISWVAGNSEQEWNLIISPIAVTDFENANIINLDNASYQASGLSASILYYVYVQAVCGEDDNSAWSQAYTFRTECGIITQYPFFEGFNETSISSCWTILNLDNDAKQWGIGTSSPYEGRSYASVSFNSIQNNDWLISPKLSVGEESLFLEFWARSSGTTFLEDFNVLVSKTGTDPEDFTITLEEITSHPSAWTRHFYNLSENGINNGDEIHIAIRCISMNKLYLDIDAFNVFTAYTGNDIIEFELTEAVNPAVIDAENHTVRVQVGQNVDLSALVPEITVSTNATINPASGVARNFTRPVIYTVTSELGEAQEWTVTVSNFNPQNYILGFSLIEQACAAIINNNDHTVKIAVKTGADITSLAPAITISNGATITPASRQRLDFTNPVTYTVTSEDNVAQEWVVTVIMLPDVICPEDMTVSAGTIVNFTGYSPENGVFSSTRAGDAVQGNSLHTENLSSGLYPITYTYTDPVTGCTKYCIFNISIHIGIDTNEIFNVNIYPNPNSGEFNIRFGGIEGKATYQVVDTKGSVLKEETVVVSNNAVQNVSLNLVPGVYYVKVTSEQQTIVEKIIVQ